MIIQLFLVLCTMKAFITFLVFTVTPYGCFGRFDNHFTKFNPFIADLKMGAIPYYTFSCVFHLFQ